MQQPLKYVITDEANSQYHHGFIDEGSLKKHVIDSTKHFYLCGPPKMMEAMTDILGKPGAAPDSVIFEK